MPKFNRVHVTRSGEIAVPAAIYWEAVNNWSNLMEWWPSPPPMPLLGCALKSGHRVDKLPCTRLVRIDIGKLPPGVDATLIPEAFEETLLFSDPEARVLYYTIGGQPLLGMRNYFAYTEVDELGPHLTRVTNTGRVDVPEGVPVELVAGLMADVYERAIIRGIGELAARTA